MTLETATGFLECEENLVCPLTWGAPFLPPWRRALTARARDRLETWCAELLPGVDVDVVEWVGADTRVPQHAVVVSFAAEDGPPAVIYVKAVDLRKDHLARALESR